MAIAHHLMNKITIDDFTQREQDVLACIMAGHISSKQIAMMLDLSPKTIEIHIGSILSKAGLQSRHQINIFVGRIGARDKMLHLFQHQVYPEFALKKTLHQLHPALENPQPSYYLVTSKNHKEATCKIATCLKYLLNRPVNCVERKEHFFSSSDCWSIYWDSVLQGWLISPPCQNNQAIMSTSVNLIQQHDKDFVAFFLQLIAPSVGTEWHARLQKEIKKATLQVSSPTSSFIMQPIRSKWYIRILLSALVIMISSVGWMIVYGKSDSIMTNVRQSPEVVRFFFPRKNIENHLREALNKKEGINTVAMTGVGGSGKTTLARHFLQNCMSPVVWEVRSDTLACIEESFARLAHALAETTEAQKELNCIMQNDNPKNRKPHIIAFVQKHLKNKKNWTLLFDNLEVINNDTQAYLPVDEKVWGDGHVLCTSRNPQIALSTCIHSSIEVGALTEKEAIGLVVSLVHSRKMLPPSDTELHQIVGKSLPPFPLDLVVATHYVCDTQTNWSQYGAYLQSAPLELEEEQRELLRDISTYDATRLIITRLVVSAINKHKEANKALLQFVMLLDSQNISKEMLGCIDKATTVDSFIRDLKKYSLITHENNNSNNYTFSLHRHTHLLLGQCCPTESSKDEFYAKKLDEQILLAVKAKNYDLIARMVPHTDHFNAASKVKLKLAGVLYYHAGLYDKARTSIEEAIQKGGHSPEDLWTLFFHGGQAYKFMLNEAKTEEFFHKCIETCHQHFPHDYQKLVTVYTQLASLYRWTKNFEKARQACDMAFSYYGRCQSPQEEDIMETYTIWGGLERLVGNYQKAEEAFKISVEMYKRHANDFAIEYARTLLMLGEVYLKQGLFKQVLALFKEATQKNQTVLPLSDVRMAWSFVRLGKAYRLSGQYSQAAEFLEKGREGCMGSSASDQMCYALLCEEMAYVYAQEKNFQKAREHANEAHVIYQKFYPHDGSRQAETLSILAHIDIQEGKLEEAETTLHRVMELLKGGHHPATFLVLEQLGCVYAKKSRQQPQESSAAYKTKAIDSFEEALSFANNHFQHTSELIDRVKRKIRRVRDEHYVDWNDICNFTMIYIP